jgi:DNA topoisomerase-1
VKKSENQLQIMEKSLEAYRQQLAERKQKGKQVESLKKRISSKRQAIARQKKRRRELKSKHLEQMKKLRERLEKRRYRDKAAIEKLKLQIKTKEKTRDYNLGTSLKSYIDPRIYCQWGKKVNYDWKLYYPKTLQRKFSWVDDNTPPIEKMKGTP